MTRRTFLTIATSDFLPRVVALARSLREVYGDDARLVALHLGEPSAAELPGTEGLQLVSYEALKLPTFWDMAFRYEKGALANALKPFFMRHVLDERGASSLVFLDSDILVYSRFEEVDALLDSGAASLVLTPHFDRPQVRAREPIDIDLLRHGVMNGGFVALADRPEARDFLAWWSDHLLTECRYEPELGYYGDQHWLDLAPALFGGVHILRHRGYNASYWNYPDRAPQHAEGEWWVGLDRLRFFHFSRWLLEEKESVEACMKRLFSSYDRQLAKLLADYRDRCLRAAAALPPELQAAVYPFDEFLDGTEIPKVVRDAYARVYPSRPRTREQLFGRGLTLVTQQQPDIPAFPRVEVPQLYVHIWNQRRDLQIFDLCKREGQIGLLRWALNHAASDYRLPDEAIEPARRSLARETEREQLVQTVLKRCIETHEAIRGGFAGVSDLLRNAEELFRLVAERTGRGQPVPVRIDSVAALFRTAHVLRAEAAGQPDAARYFDEIDSHGHYLAEKLGTAYASYLHSGKPVGEPMLEADAVLNACSVLTTAAEHWAGARPNAVRADRAGSRSSPLPPRALAELEELARIEPRLGLQLQDASAFPLARARPEHHPLYRCLTDNEDVLQPPPRAVIALAHADGVRREPEGAALVAAAQRVLGKEHVLVTILSDRVAGADEGLETGTRLFAAARRAPHLSRAERLDFARDYLAAMQPPVIVNCDCPVIWELFERYGKPLSATSRLYALSSRFDGAGQGAAAGFAVSYLAETLPHLSGAYADNAALKAALEDLFALPPSSSDKVQVLRRPVIVPDPAPRARKQRLRKGRDVAGYVKVLAASPKLEGAALDRLLDIARARPNYDFEVYGRVEDGRAGDLDLPNVRYRGGIEDVSDLPYGAADVFLSTSSWSDVADVLLAAAAAGLPIVAADLGGAGELVSDERGWPIRDCDAPAAYGEALDCIAADEAAGAERVQAMTEHLKRARSPAAYEARVKELGIFHVA